MGLKQTKIGRYFLRMDIAEKEERPQLIPGDSFS